MKESLYDLEHLKSQLKDDSQLNSYIANFIVNIAEESCNDMLHSYIKKDNEESCLKAEKLKMSLSMYGIHSIEKDIDKLYDLMKDSRNFNEILPIIQNIKSHLRNVKVQMLKDFKMVITLVN